jgi:SAM-dependent methyltransferase
VMLRQQEEEIKWWMHNFKQMGLEAFLAVRRDDLHRYFFASALLQECGRGLDYGCALVSIFEFAPELHVDAIDPLLPEYDKIYRHHGTVNYVSAPSGLYDWIYCCNVIDHTPDPQTIVDDFKRLLVPLGRLYFEVHFDDSLGAPHFSLWRMDTVKKYLSWLEVVKERVVRDPVHPQFHYEAILLNA